MIELLARYRLTSLWVTAWAWVAWYLELFRSVRRG